MTNTEKFLGSGLAFPLLLDDSGKVVVSTGIDLIKSSIYNIINWPYKHRFFLEEYGCRIEELLEEPNDNISFNLARRYITDALNDWEKRISIIPSDIAVERVDDKAVYLKLKYTIVSTKKEETFIYPFYKQINY